MGVTLIENITESRVFDFISPVTDYKNKCKQINCKCKPIERVDHFKYLGMF